MTQKCLFPQPASVGKTGRVIAAHEDTSSFGYGAEIVARIADELFTSLDAPVERVAALATWVGHVGWLPPQLEAMQQLLVFWVIRSAPLG
jgi:pyruvate/2-oxoglutarate/acetoin dehydrogenase E1 component